MPRKTIVPYDHADHKDSWHSIQGWSSLFGCSKYLALWNLEGLHHDSAHCLISVWSALDITDIMDKFWVPFRNFPNRRPKHLSKTYPDLSKTYLRHMQDAIQIVIQDLSMIYPFLPKAYPGLKKSNIPRYLSKSPRHIQDLSRIYPFTDPSLSINLSISDNTICFCSWPLRNWGSPSLISWRAPWPPQSSQIGTFLRSSGYVHNQYLSCYLAGLTPRIKGPRQRLHKFA